MIYHLLDGGAVRTGPGGVGFICAACLSTWTDKLDLWQDAAPAADVPNDAVYASNIAQVKALAPIRDPGLADVGMVVISDTSVISPPIEVKPPA